MTMRLGIAVARDEGPEVAFGDPHHGAEVVRDELLALDPAADSARRHFDELRHLGDCEEFDLIVAVPATTDMAESSRFRIAVAGGWVRKVMPDSHHVKIVADSEDDVLVTNF